MSYFKLNVHKRLKLPRYLNQRIDSSQILHNSEDHQVLFMSNPNYTVYAPNESKIADSRHFKYHISATF